MNIIELIGHVTAFTGNSFEDCKQMTYPQFKGVLKGVERKLEIKFALQGVELSKSAEKAGNIHVVNGNDFDDIQDVLSHF